MKDNEISTNENTTNIMMYARRRSHHSLMKLQYTGFSLEFLVWGPHGPFNLKNRGYLTEYRGHFSPVFDSDNEQIIITQSRIYTNWEVVSFLIYYTANFAQWNT